MQTVFLTVLKTDRPGFPPENLFIQPSRQEKIRALKTDEAKKSSLGVEAALRITLTEAGFPADLCYRYTSLGQPVFDCPELFISLSHSGPYAVCALSDKPVGVDVEQRRSVDERLLKKILHPEENEDDFFRIWTAKEAFFKQQGTGIVRPMKTLRVSKETVEDSERGIRLFLYTEESGNASLALCTEQPPDLRKIKL